MFEAHGMLDNIAKLRNGVKSLRVSSYDRKGGNDDFIKIGAGEKIDIARIKGAGIIKHIWCTFDCKKDPLCLRKAVIRMYWDGEENPSVQSPLGDFFGQGWGESYNYISLPFAASPKGGKGLNCFLPMPFGTEARIEIENQSSEPFRAFYFYVDYEKHGKIEDDMGRFHAWWNHELTDPRPEGENEWRTLGPYPNNPSDKDNYVFLEAQGKGHYIGVNYFVDCPTPMWYGEGDDMFLVDGEPWPGSMHGTGTEDYFCTAYCPREIYLHPFFGCAKTPSSSGFLGRTHVYRFHFADPIYFEKSLRASIEHGHANALTLDLASVAYWYQNEPHKLLAPIQTIDERMPMSEITTSDIHLWRHAWRQAKGGGKLWGNET